MNLRLLQLGDSALPIGGYSHSWGLEAAIDRGLVTGAAGLEHWTRLWLREAFAPCEGVVAAAACRAAACDDWPEAARANALLDASVTPPTLRHASREMGEQLLALAEAWSWAAASIIKLRGAAAQCREAPEGRPSLARGFNPWLGTGVPQQEAPEGRPSLARGFNPWLGTGDAQQEAPEGRPGITAAPARPQGLKPLATDGRPSGAEQGPVSAPWHHAPVFAVLAAAAGASPEDALLVYLHQAALGVIGAGVRAIPIGHTHGQQVLARLHDDIRELAGELAGCDLDTAGSFCPAYEVLCHAQANLYTRLFRS